MSRSPADTPRLWPLRVVQFAPVVMLALFLGVWFAVPASVRSTSLRDAVLESTSDPASSRYDRDLELQLLLGISPTDADYQRLSQPVLTGPRLRSACDSNTARVMGAPWRLHGPSGALTPFALPASDPAWAPLSDFEKRTAARVFAFAIPARRTPQVALSAVASRGVLTKAETAEYESSGTIETLRNAHALDTHGGLMSCMRVDASLSGGSASTDDSRDVTLIPTAIQGRFYECYFLSPPNGADISELSNSDETKPLFDPSAVDSPVNRQRLRTMAEEAAGAVFVVGPIDGTPVPLRLPPGTTAAHGSAIASAAARLLATHELAAMSADDQSTPVLNAESGLRRLNPALAAQFGGGAWFTTAISQSESITAASAEGRWAVVDPMLFVAVWDDNPDAALMWESLGRTPIHVFWVWLGMRLPLVLGCLGVLLVGSLMASPVAFWRERQLTAELELEREQARVRELARSRVLDRLTDLSRRIDAAADKEVSGRTDHDVTRAAHDIEATIAELRRTLGERAPSGGHDA